ncbi:MAG: hydrogenase maturation protease [Bacteroidales bacterium]|nr:hydrogenase maturation protease [Bacteroidales bacterium]
MENKTNDILVFGVGNEILTDDGIGPKLVKRLQKEFTHSGIDYDTAFLGGMELLEYIQGYETVVFIDAIRTRNGIPGDVYQLGLSNFKETLHLSNVHDISFITAFELGKKLGLEIPKQVHIIAVEIVEDLIFSDSFSQAIQEKYEEIYKEVREFIHKLSINKTDDVKIINQNKIL